MMIESNDVTNNATAGIYIGAFLARTRIRNNRGFETDSDGTVTIPMFHHRVQQLKRGHCAARRIRDTRAPNTLMGVRATRRNGHVVSARWGVGWRSP
jgi:hypothetical protein